MRRLLCYKRLDTMGSMYDKALAKLRSTKAELAESIQANKNLERTKAIGEEGLEDPHDCITELLLPSRHRH